MITPAEALRQCPSVNPVGLLGGLFSPTEVNVDPREAIARLPRWLAEAHGVHVHFNTNVTRIEAPHVIASDGRRWRAEQIIICGGADHKTLYPHLFNDVLLRRCKLQMLATAPQSPGWDMGPMIAGGLTLQHYANFRACPSLPALRQRIVTEMPEINQFGIHVLFSQNSSGEVVIGDSHEYDDQITPFSNDKIDRLILQHARALLTVPNERIERRWSGEYVKHPRLPAVVLEPEPGVHVVAATGGTGMTMSFGLAEHLWDQWLPRDPATNSRRTQLHSAS